MREPDSFYYITHRNNLASILEQGIYSREYIENNNIDYTAVHDEQIVSARKNKRIPDGETLTKYVNLFFQPRNAMMYRLICNLKKEDLVVLQVSNTVLRSPKSRIADGNAASGNTNFYDSNSQGLDHLNEAVFKKEYWSDQDDSKRQMMAELLVPKHIDASNILTIYVASDKISKCLRKEFDGIEVAAEPHMFFRPQWVKPLISNPEIFLVKGDMFFSSAQTFTISVNIRGVMGKGLASRTKYQFPDAYVRYQDDCRSRKIKMGKPTLYKRSSLIEDELADDPSIVEHKNGSRWFLFFPTKNDWRRNSNLEDIEKGMQWLVKNYEKEKIKSIALPALGCGLGNLKWEDVGPVMCKYLQQMGIRSHIYLPMEKEIPREYLSRDYLITDI